MLTTISEASVGSLTIAEVTAEATRRLREAGIESPARDARILITAALGLEPHQLISRPEMPVGSAQLEQVNQFIARRLAREPVSRILGSRGFYGRQFEISPATLDPRPDSETAIEAAIELVGSGPRGRDLPLRILDVGTGSGCLLVTLLAELPCATGLGTDIDAAALQVAQRNAYRHGVASRAEWKLARSLNGIAGPFDLLVANPPYVPTGMIEDLDPEVREYDPWSALDGGSDGLDVYRELVRDLVRVVPDGWAVFEVGKGQASAVSELLTFARIGAQSPEIRTFRDLNGVDRCVAWRARN